MKNTELAWAAGFFDGEGNIRWNTNKLPKRGNRTRSYGGLVLQLAQVDRFVLDRFSTAVGVGRVYGPYAARDKTRQPYFTYAACGAAAVEAFDKLTPYLSPVKISQGSLALIEYEKQKARPKLGNGRIVGKKYGPYKKRLSAVPFTSARELSR